MYTDMCAIIIASDLMISFRFRQHFVSISSAFRQNWLGAEAIIGIAGRSPRDRREIAEISQEDRKDRNLNGDDPPEEILK